MKTIARIIIAVVLLALGLPLVAIGIAFGLVTTIVGIGCVLLMLALDDWVLRKSSAKILDAPERSVYHDGE